jgi:cystathionine beta-lyase/cystathionine gamma-synthase
LDEHSQDAAPSGNPTGAVVVPISLATTFRQSKPGQATAADDPNSFGSGYEYSRTGNPTRGAFERAMIAAERGSRYAVAFASGSAATSAIVHCLKSGDHILCIDDVYGGTQRYFRRIVRPNMGIAIDFCDMASADALPFQSNTKLLWLETPTNPTLKVSDISAIAQKCKDRNCWLAVDNTFCSPYFQSPLELGADVVVHSVTKYIGGHRYGLDRCDLMGSQANTDPAERLTHPT